MSYDLNVCFANAIRACRLGKRKPIAMSSGASGKLFHDLAQQFIKRRLNDTDFIHYCKTRDLSRLAVKAIHKGDFDGAKLGFNKVNAYLSSHPVSDEVENLSLSWKNQGEAYLAIREKKLTLARLHLNNAMCCDYALEKNYHYDLFHVARIHVVHLLLRVEAADGKLEYAIDLAQNIYQYLAGSQTELSVGEGWSIGLATSIPDDLRNALLARIASEVGTILSSQPYTQQASLFSRFPGWDNQQNQPLYIELYQWGRAKQAFLQGDTHLFLDFAVPFLTAGRQETNLWYATVLDLLSSCQALRCKQTQHFRDEIIEDATKWETLPAEFSSKSLIQNYPQVVNRAENYRHKTAKRRFHAYTVGLPRTGTTSIYALFKNYRSANEYMEQGTVRRIIERHDGVIDSTVFKDYLALRDREGGLEMDSASFNHFYLDLLIDCYPQAKFIFMIREPFAWMNSYLKMLMRWRVGFEQQQKRVPQWMSGYGRILFDDFSWSMISTNSAVKENIEPLAANFLKHWSAANQRILELLPNERSLIIKTNELSSKQHLIADFMQIPEKSLTAHHHVNISPDQTDLFQGLSSSLFEDHLNQQGGSDVKQFFHAD